MAPAEPSPRSKLDLAAAEKLADTKLLTCHRVSCAIDTVVDTLSGAGSNLQKALAEAMNGPEGLELALAAEDPAVQRAARSAFHACGEIGAGLIGLAAALSGELQQPLQDLERTVKADRAKRMEELEELRRKHQSRASALTESLRRKEKLGASLKAALDEQDKGKSRRFGFFGGKAEGKESDARLQQTMVQQTNAVEELGACMADVEALSNSAQQGREALAEAMGRVDGAMKQTLQRSLQRCSRAWDHLGRGLQATAVRLSEDAAATLEAANRAAGQEPVALAEEAGGSAPSKISADKGAELARKTMEQAIQGAPSPVRKTSDAALFELQVEAQSPTGRRPVDLDVATEAPSCPTSLEQAGEEGVEEASSEGTISPTGKTSEAAMGSAHEELLAKQATEDAASLACNASQATGEMSAHEEQQAAVPTASEAPVAAAPLPLLELAAEAGLAKEQAEGPEAQAPLEEPKAVEGFQAAAAKPRPPALGEEVEEAKEAAPLEGLDTRSSTCTISLPEEPMQQAKALAELGSDEAAAAPQEEAQQELHARRVPVEMHIEFSQEQLAGQNRGCEVVHMDDGSSDETMSSQGERVADLRDLEGPSAEAPVVKQESAMSKEEIEAEELMRASQEEMRRALEESQALMQATAMDEPVVRLPRVGSRSVSPVKSPVKGANSSPWAGPEYFNLDGSGKVPTPKRGNLSASVTGTDITESETLSQGDTEHDEMWDMDWTLPMAASQREEPQATPRRVEQSPRMPKVAPMSARLAQLRAGTVKPLSEESEAPSASKGPTEFQALRAKLEQKRNLRDNESPAPQSPAVSKWMAGVQPDVAQKLEARRRICDAVDEEPEAGAAPEQLTNGPVEEKHEKRSLSQSPNTPVAKARISGVHPDVAEKLEARRRLCDAVDEELQAAGL